jgi:heat shock protein HslJ
VLVSRGRAKNGSENADGTPYETTGVEEAPMSPNIRSSTGMVVLLVTFLGSPASTAMAQPPDSTALAGTSWQLVKFQGADGATLTPGDRAKYTIEFGAGGQLTARVDCNRGRGTWKSSGPNQLQLGPLALTRAQCPLGSLHDHIVKQWTNIRSYVTRDGHLFLSLMADGGIYEFEPLKTKP